MTRKIIMNYSYFLINSVLSQSVKKWYHQNHDIEALNGNYIMVFEGVIEATENKGHGRFVVQRIDPSLSVIGSYQIHTRHPPEGVDLYTRDVFRESERTGIPVKLLVGSDGSILRAELYHEYWDDLDAKKDPS